MSNGSANILGDVTLVSKLRRNLISLGLLNSSGYNYKSRKGILKIMRGALVIMRGKLLNGLYKLKGSVVGNSMTTNTTKTYDTNFVALKIRKHESNWATRTL